MEQRGGRVEEEGLTEWEERVEGRKRERYEEGNNGGGGGGFSVSLTHAKKTSVATFQVLLHTSLLDKR